MLSAKALLLIFCLRRMKQNRAPAARDERSAFAKRPKNKQTKTKQEQQKQKQEQAADSRSRKEGGDVCGGGRGVSVSVMFVACRIDTWALDRLRPILAASAAGFIQESYNHGNKSRNLSKSGVPVVLGSQSGAQTGATERRDVMAQRSRVAAASSSSLAQDRQKIGRSTTSLFSDGGGGVRRASSGRHHIRVLVCRLIEWLID
jgi:hypothetical protein